MATTIPQLPNHAVIDGLADRLAGRYRNSRGTTPEDLVQTAQAGLIAAVDRYNPSHSNPFVPYAVACVVGELKRHLRETSWRLHVPRPQKERALRLCRAADELHQRLGRSPTTRELAEQLQVGEEEALEGLAAVTSRRMLAALPRLNARSSSCGSSRTWTRMRSRPRSATPRCTSPDCSAEPWPECVPNWWNPD